MTFDGARSPADRPDLVQVGAGVVRPRRKLEVLARSSPGVEWTARDLAARERIMHEAKPRRVAVSSCNPALLVALVAEHGEAAVALAAGVKNGTVRGALATARAGLRARELFARPTKMEPRGSRRLDCLSDGECLRELLRVHGDPPGASCPVACPDHNPPDRQLERDLLASERPGPR